MNRKIRRTTVLVVGIVLSFLLGAGTALAAEPKINKPFDPPEVGTTIDLGYGSVVGIRCEGEWSATDPDAYETIFTLRFDDTFDYFGEPTEFVDFYCIDKTMAAPGSSGTAGEWPVTFVGNRWNSRFKAQAVVRHVDTQACTVTYSITCYMVMHEGTANETISQRYTNYQRMYADVVIPWIPTASISLQKYSVLPVLTEGNELYSLAGAEYGLYLTEEDAEVDANRIETFVTLADGSSQVVDNVEIGTYYVKELIPSPGYKLDPRVRSISVVGGANVFSLPEVPYSDPPAIWKVDSHLVFDPKEPFNGDINLAQGNATLEGAQFEIQYYSGGYYSASEYLNMAPTRSWIVRSLSDGYAGVDPECYVSGDDLYFDELGDPTIPLGTVTIREVAAPEGYLLPENPPTILVHITTNGPVYSTGHSAAFFADDVIAGNIAVQKTLLHPGGQAADPSVLEGVKIAVVSSSTGETVETLTLDARGAATSGQLPYGTYQLFELPETLPEGVQPYAWTAAGSTENIAFATVNITEARIYDANFTDYTDTTTKVLKTDADTGELLSGAEFTLYSAPKEYVSIEDGNVTLAADFDADDPDAWEFYDALTTGSDGVASFENLPFGYYRLIETSAPDGYLDETGTQNAATTVVHDFVVDLAHSGAEIPVADKRVNIAVEIYERTIAVTSALLDATEYELGSNVGGEEVVYHVGARNASSVDTDRFTLTTPMDELNDLGLRATRLWTGTATGDKDGRAMLQFTTANSPEWQDWSEISVLEPQGFAVEELGLAEGDYLTGLRVQFGPVTYDFHSGTDYGDGFDWCFAVVGTQPLQPGDGVLVNASQAYTARDVTPTTTIDAEAVDQVETRVIDSFILGEATRWSELGNGGIPRTGDTTELVAGWLLFAALISGSALVVLVARRRAVSATEDE